MDRVGPDARFASPIIQLDPSPSLAPAIALVDGREIAMYGNDQNLTGKLHGRGARLPARDVFDVAVARREDPGVLRTAVVRTVDAKLATGSVGDVDETE